MKDSRFIELVNLYIDRQITAAETAELESEMQATPRRRAVYRQYCQMHRATKSVYESFRANATDASPDSATGRGVIASFETQQRQRRHRWSYYAGGLAAAAALALAFVRYDAVVTPAAPVKDLAVVATPPAAEVVVAEAPVAILVSAPLDDSASLRNQVAIEPNYKDMLTALREEEKKAFDSGQILTSQTASLFDDGVFDSRQIRPAFSQRVFRSKPLPGQKAELETTVFQFQR